MEVGVFSYGRKEKSRLPEQHLSHRNHRYSYQ